MDNLILEEMTWTDVKQYLDDIEIAVLPTGSYEQHGPHQTFATDVKRAYAFSRMLGERLFPRALVCPPLPVGVAFHHLEFPGTLTLRTETFINTIYDIAWSLKQHGINKIVLINGHGGNRPALTSACTRLRYELDVQSSWVGMMSDMGRDLILDWVESDAWGHGDEVEVSQALYLAPEVVKQERLVPGDLVDKGYNNRDKTARWWGKTPQTFAEITANGALGDARKATVEFGRQLTETILDRTERFIHEYYFCAPESSPENEFTSEDDHPSEDSFS